MESCSRSAGSAARSRSAAAAAHRPSADPAPGSPTPPILTQSTTTVPLPPPLHLSEHPRDPLVHFPVLQSAGRHPAPTLLTIPRGRRVRTE